MACLPPLSPDDPADDARLARYRRLMIRVLFLLALGSLVIGTPGDHSLGARNRGEAVQVAQQKGWL